MSEPLGGECPHDGEGPLGGGERLGVAIVGCGNIAGRYAEDIGRQPHVRLVGVADLDEERARTVAGQYDTRTYASVAEVLDDQQVSIVVNLTSHRAHEPVSATAIASGRHVFTEKPMAMTARRWVDEGRLGKVRLAWADVNWGRIEEWHPDAEGILVSGRKFRIGAPDYILASVEFEAGPSSG